MLTPMLRFEMGYHFRQISFRIAALLFLILGLLMPFGNYGGDEIHRNAPHVINFIICLLSLFTIFVSTLLCLAAASVVCLVGVLSAIWEGLTSISIKRWR